MRGGEHSEEQTSQQPPHFPNAAFDVIALAASAGGLSALSCILISLPDDFPAALVVVQHLDPRHRSLMADILSRRTPLTVKQAEEGDRLRPATVYIAPPNRHLLVNPDGTLSLSQSELVHFVRPQPTCSSNRWLPVTEIDPSPSYSPARVAMAPWGCKPSRKCRVQ